MNKEILSLFFAAFAFFGVAGAAEQSAPPEWYLNDIKALSAGGGRWVADNAAYKSENEPFDSYATEWRSGFDGATMTGRLFGCKDGKPLDFDFWEFRQYWHPGREEAIVEQFGWGGAVGIGSLVADHDGTRSDQQFFNADGSATRTGHKSRFENETTYVTESFDIIGDEWKPRRKYVWKRQSPPSE